MLALAIVIRSVPWMPALWIGTVSLGMSKMNVATELRIVFSDAIKEVFAKNPEENDPRKYMVPAKQALKAAAIEKMRLCGSIGKA